MLKMKLHCFAGFWNIRRTSEEEEVKINTPWFISTQQQHVVNILPPQINYLPSSSSSSSIIMDNNVIIKDDEDFRALIKTKAEKHRNYFRTLIVDRRGTIGEPPTVDCSETMEMAQKFQNIDDDDDDDGTNKSSNNIKINETSISLNNVEKRQRRQGVYERERFQEEIIHFKSVKKLRDEYTIATNMLTTEEVGTRLYNNQEENFLSVPSVQHNHQQQNSDYGSSAGSGASDDERCQNRKFQRCGSSDSAMGHSDEDATSSSSPNHQSTIIASIINNNNSPYSPRGSIDHSNVPSKLIIESQTVLFPIILDDRKLSVDCASEDADFDIINNISRRQSCLTSEDDGDDAASSSRYRYWRTPSVVVSDYSDDLMGLTLEDIEYIRTSHHRNNKDNNLTNNSSPESSLHSSCSNLNYCGSTISGLDSEYILSKPYRKSSNCSTCSTLSGDEEPSDSTSSSCIINDSSENNHQHHHHHHHHQLRPKRRFKEVSFNDQREIMVILDLNLRTSSRSPSPTSASNNPSPRSSPNGSPRLTKRKISPRTSNTPQSPTSPLLESRRGSYTGYELYQKSLLEVPLFYNDYGDPSSDDLSSEWESERDEPKRDCERGKSSGWRKLRNIVQWTPFFQTYKKHRYPWVQLAGHQGNFKAGPDQGTILKKLCVKEEKCFQVLMKDVLRPYVPEYRGLVASDDGECEYIQLQDLLGDFISPCVMDCKIGVRTYLEEELAKAKEKPKLRKDMYEKMCQIDQNAPSDEEHKLKGVTKPRYMVWRETISSTATLGFRIEGIRNSDGTSSKDFKTTKSRDQIMEAFEKFTEGFPHAVPKYIQRLKAIKATLQESNFFETHEVIGSSLLFVHDRSIANVWLIDFAKTVKLPNDMNITHNSKWKVGNHEDGYLIGINNLIKIFMAVLENQPICITHPLSLEDPPDLVSKIQGEINKNRDTKMENDPLS